MGEKRVRIGNQTASSAETLREPFDYAVENGFDAFEWFLDTARSGDDWEEAEPAPEELREIGRTAAENDIELSVHTPWWIDPLEPAGYEHLVRSLEFAIELEARNLNTHIRSKRGIDAFVEALSPFLHRLADLPIRLSIENIPSSRPDEFNELFARFADAAAATRPPALSAVTAVLAACLAPAGSDLRLRAASTIEAVATRASCKGPPNSS